MITLFATNSHDSSFLTAMSQSYYPPATPGSQPTATTATYSQPATTATYPYGTYQPYYYQWPPYSYSAPQQTPTRAPTAGQTTAATTAISSSTQRPATTYSSYSSFPRDTSSSTAAGRGSRKQSSTKGLFAKECLYRN
jgi:transcription initiation factor TFIID subunit 13